MVNARTAAADAEEVANEIRQAGGQAAFTLADVGDPGAVTMLVKSTMESFGRLDILVNNASVRRETDFVKLDYQEWREILATTLDGAYLCSHSVLPHLIQSGGGAIVNIGGLSAHTGAARRAHVCAAKAGLVGLTRALAHDLAPHGITVNCVAPGLIDTRRGSTGQPAHHALHAPLAGRLGKPQEIGALVRFLCGPDARYITGQTIHANGGVFMG
jgi:3-oxoacyl-[acyl-carrier protein] reductase